MPSLPTLSAPAPPTTPASWASPHESSAILRVRAEQQTPEWKARYAVRSGVESTVNEFAHGHGMRRCRYRGQGKALIQHVLTAIAVNIERLSGLPPTEAPPSPDDRPLSRTTSTSARFPG
ncbi:transposase [Streptomyces sp. NPDC096310]|uniref:transposase n=1 Tax=Streptomyces sp. NPDC096310 TaxID=3366082 RepID=UPI0038015969